MFYCNTISTGGKNAKKTQYFQVTPKRCLDGHAVRAIAWPPEKACWLPWITIVFGHKFMLDEFNMFVRISDCWICTIYIIFNEHSGFNKPVFFSYRCLIICVAKFHLKFSMIPWSLHAVLHMKRLYFLITFERYALLSFLLSSFSPNTQNTTTNAYRLDHLNRLQENHFKLTNSCQT